MNISETDRKRLARIANELPYACTLSDLKWLVQFATRMLKEHDARPSVVSRSSLAKEQRPKTKS